MLELEGVFARAGTFRLENVSLNVGKGESHVLLGPSGAGKTTLLDVIMGMRTPESGRIALFGRDLAGVPIEKRGMGYLPQRLALFPHLAVRDNVIYGPRSHRLPAAEYQPVVDALVEATGIGHLLDRHPGTLSGGEGQRVALVRALAARPPLLLLDEPFSALNQSLRRELWQLLKTLQSEYGFAILMITHDLTEGFFMGDNVTVLIDGQIQQSSDSDTVWWHPTTLAVARYLGIRNIFSGTVDRLEAETALVDCPLLGGRVRVPIVLARRPPAAGTEVYVGIRSEFVALRDAAHPSKEDELVLEGRFARISVTGTDVILLFQPNDKEITLEISVGRRLLRNFDVEDGRTGTVGLPMKDLLLFTA